MRRAATLVPHQPRLVALPVALLFGLALVVQLLALGDAQFQLGDALGVEIELQRDQRHAFALDGDGQLGGLALVHQQLARALGLVVEAAGLGVFGDIGVDQEDLAILGVGVAFADGGLAGAQRS